MSKYEDINIVKGSSQIIKREKHSKENGSLSLQVDLDKSTTFFYSWGAKISYNHQNNLTQETTDLFMCFFYIFE